MLVTIRPSIVTIQIASDLSEIKESTRSLLLQMSMVDADIGQIRG